MADAADSKSAPRKGVWVQVPPPASFFNKRAVHSNALHTLAHHTNMLLRTSV